MKKILLVLTVLFVLAALVFIFLPANICSAVGIPDEPTNLKDPHFHTGTWTTCMNELNQDCNK